MVRWGSTLRLMWTGVTLWVWRCHFGGRRWRLPSSTRVRRNHRRLCTHHCTPRRGLDLWLVRQRTALNCSINNINITVSIILMRLTSENTVKQTLWNVFCRTVDILIWWSVCFKCHVCFILYVFIVLLPLWRNKRWWRWWLQLDRCRYRVSVDKCQYRYWPILILASALLSVVRLPVLTFEPCRPEKWPVWKLPKLVQCTTYVH